MADEEQQDKQITFNVKYSLTGNEKHVVTVSESLTVADLKQKLSTSEFLNVEPSRQRLIYAGRVLKDEQELSSYKIKDGNTVHAVLSAASSSSSAQQSSQPSAANPSAASENTGVPQNLSTGPGNDPLAGLTGARYAGFAQMPSANQFGPDGGMGPPGNPDDLIRMLENPMFQSQMQEAMNNPQVIQMIQNNPMLRDHPEMREMINNPEMRRMMMDPNILRASIQMQEAMGRGRGAPGGGMPMPGVTDNTPQGQQQQNTQGQNPEFPLTNLAMPGSSGPPQGNPFAALFGNQGFGNPSATPGQGTGTTEAGATSDNTSRDPQQPQQTPPNPFASMFGSPPAGGQQQGQNSLASMTQQMMQNPEMMRAAMNMMGMGGAGAGGAGGAGGQQGGAPGSNPFANLFGGMGGMGAGAGSPAPQDSRPPEELYSSQIQQLNEMGFHDFQRNVRALRMAGGNVEGAVEMLLGGAI